MPDERAFALCRKLGNPKAAGALRAKNHSFLSAQGGRLEDGGTTGASLIVLDQFWAFQFAMCAILLSAVPICRIRGVCPVCL